ncbi:unnamed protein product [Cercospora beticola]|nr:unnamed protein product [Cercospora beticola]
MARLSWFTWIFVAALGVVACISGDGCNCNDLYAYCRCKGIPSYECYPDSKMAKLVKKNVLDDVVAGPE